MARYCVSVRSFTELEELEGSWTSADFLRVLEELEFEDAAKLPESELRDMCILALQDREPAEAAAVLLAHRLGDALEPGQIQNASQEMLDEKLWEEYADMELHERMFHVGSLLYQAFPGSVPVPDAVEVRLELKAEDADGERVLAKPLHESLLVRLLADGMPDSATLNRLFGEAVGGQAFPEAESIAWTVEAEPVDARTLNVSVTGAGYWLDALRGTVSYGSSAKADPMPHD